MAVSLQKGGNVSLSKEAPGLTEVIVGLGWDPRVTDGTEFDLDASVFVTGENGKVLNDASFIFYNNKTSADGSIEHLGDNRSGQGDGDDEQVNVKLNGLGADVKKLVFAVTIHDAEARKQSFGQVGNAYIRVLNKADGKGDCSLRPVRRRLHRDRHDLRRTVPSQRRVQVQGYRPRFCWRPEASG